MTSPIATFGLSGQQSRLARNDASGLPPDSPYAKRARNWRSARLEGEGVLRISQLSQVFDG